MAGRGQVTLQVLPLCAAAQAYPVSPFTILDFADPADPPVVYTEHLTGGLLLDDPARCGPIRRCSSGCAPRRSAPARPST